MIIIGMCLGCFLMVFRIWEFDNFPDLTSYVLGGIFGLLWGGVLGLCISEIYRVATGVSILFPNENWSLITIASCLTAFAILRIIHHVKRKK